MSNLQESTFGESDPNAWQVSPPLESQTSVRLRTVAVSDGFAASLNHHSEKVTDTPDVSRVRTFVVSLAEDRVPKQKQRLLSPSTQREEVEGVITALGSDMANCTIISLKNELRITLPKALFPESATVGSGFKLGITKGADGFRAPTVSMTNIVPSKTVQAIRSEIQGLLANFGSRTAG